jgi:Uma2 family endonuclease
MCPAVIVHNEVKEIVAVSTATVAPTVVSLSEYLGTIYRPDCEYVDGELLERNVGEWDHSRLQTLLARYLGNREQHWGIVVATEQRVQVKASRFRVPDVLVMAGPAPDGQIVSTPPFLCIEILSPSDRVGEMQERIDDYLNFGVKYVWLIHPRTQRAFIYSPGRVEEVRDGVLRAFGPDISVPFSELDVPLKLMP